MTGWDPKINNSHAWGNTNLTVYSPFADNLDFERDLKDPSLCPLPSPVDIIESVKDPVGFYSSLTAEQKEQYIKDFELSLEKLDFERFSEELLIRLINETKEPLKLFNTLTSLDKKTALFPKLSHETHKKIFSQWHTAYTFNFGYSSCTHSTHVNEESIALFNSLSDASKSVLLNSFETSQKRAMSQNTEIFKSLPKDVQQTSIIDHIQYDLDPSNLSFYQFFSRPQISTNILNLFALMSVNNQKDVFLKLSSNAQAKMINFLSEDLKATLFTGDLTPDNLIKIFSALNTNEEKKSFFLSLTDVKKRTVFNSLDSKQRKELSIWLLPANSLAQEFAQGNSPFTLEGANRFLDKVSLYPTKKRLKYVFLLNTKNLRVQNFNENHNCSSQDVAHQACRIMQLQEVHIHCSEESEKGYWGSWINSATPLIQLEDNKPYNCQIKLLGKEGKTFSEEFFFPHDAFKYLKFANNMPPLSDQLKEKYTALSLSNLRRVANEKGASLATTFNTTTEMIKKAFGLFEPEHQYAGYFKNGAEEQKEEGKILRVEVKEDINSQGIELNATYQVDDQGEPFQWVKHHVQKTGNTFLQANNPSTISNWVNFFNKTGISYEAAYPNVLTIAKSSASQSSDKTFGSWLNFVSTKRTSDLALFNILPAIACGAAIKECKKFIENAIKHPKKTNGQKVAGIIMGTIGILASAALGYNRLSKINLSL